MSARVSAPTIRPLAESDHAAWQTLWLQYLSFHGIWADDAPTSTWPRLMDPHEPIFAIGAFVDERLVGFAHFLFHRHTWTSANVCLLADVFTSPDARRGGVARALVESVFVRAADAGADHVYGTVLRSSESSQQLYDQVAERLHVLTYRHQL